MQEAARVPIGDRFWDKVDKNGPLPERYPELGPCWLWRGDRHSPDDTQGYGRIRRYDETRARWGYAYAHRIAWELTNGPLPRGAHVLHRCDNPPCCNPAHLFTGDQRSNTADRNAKGRTASGDRSGTRRHPERFPRGERVPWAKLTDAQADVIRTAWAAGGVSQAGLARLYGVDQSHVSRLVRGLTRKPTPA